MRLAVDAQPRLHVAFFRRDYVADAVAKYLGEPLDKFPMNLSDTANTSAGSIPTLFDRLNREGRFKRGDILVLSGFGGGLTWGATVIRY